MLLRLRVLHRIPSTLFSSTGDRPHTTQIKDLQLSGEAVVSSSILLRTHTAGRGGEIVVLEGKDQLRTRRVKCDDEYKVPALLERERLGQSGRA